MTLPGISESLFFVTKRLPGESHVPKEEACLASWEKKRYRKPHELRCWARFLRDVQFWPSGSYHIPPGEKENHRLKSDFWWDMLVTTRVPSPTVTMARFSSGFPTKDEIILVVTIPGWGVGSNLCPDALWDWNIYLHCDWNCNKKCTSAHIGNRPKDCFLDYHRESMCVIRNTTIAEVRDLTVRFNHGSLCFKQTRHTNNDKHTHDQSYF